VQENIKYCSKNHWKIQIDTNGIQDS